MLNRLLGMDAALLAWLLMLPQPHWVQELMRAISLAGSRGGVWIALGLWVAVFTPRRAAAAWQVFLAVFLAHVLANAILKPLIDRPRPLRLRAEISATGPATPSFPSGHAAEAVAGAVTLSRARPNWRGRLWTLAFLMGLSRLLLGVHYPLDVAAGALVGWGCAVVVVGSLRPLESHASRLPS